MTFPVFFLAIDQTAPASVPEARDMSIQLLLIIFIFVVVFYVLYLVYKHLLPGRRNGGAFVFGRNKNIKVLEITSVGPGSTIQLVRVSEEYFLIGVTKQSITFMTKLDGASIGEAYAEANASPEEAGARPKFVEFLINRKKNPPS